MREQTIILLVICIALAVRGVLRVTRARRDLKRRRAQWER